MSKKSRVDFDHHSAAWVEDPYSVYQHMRGQCPLSYTDAHGGFWLLSRYEDVSKALMDWQSFSSQHPGRIAIPHTTPQRDIPGIPIEVDPPAHSAYRQLVAPFFAKAEVAKLEAALLAKAEALIKDFKAAGECELVSAYATPLLAHALALFLNLPLADLQRIEAWAEAIFAGRARHPEAAQDAMEQLNAYIAEQLAQRKQQPCGDLFSALVEAEIEGVRLTDQEQLGYGRIVLLAGREATIDGLSNSLHYLASQPEACQRLRQEPELMTTAVEEFLRFMSPIQLLGRVATTDKTMYNQTIEADDSVAMVYASANRDERKFKQAERCLLDRKPNPHLAFGAGHHYCLGSHLARLVLRVGISTFLRHMASFELSSSQPAQRKANGDARGFVSLVIKFELA